MTDIDYLKKYLPKEKLSAGLNKLKEGNGYGISFNKR